MRIALCGGAGSWQLCQPPVPFLHSLEHRVNRLLGWRADHKMLLQLEKEVDTLVTRIKAEMPIEECQALLAELSVSARRHMLPSCCPSRK